MSSRHEDPTPVKCSDCGWEGTVRECKHGYIACPNGDVEPWDYCPECGSSWLMEPELEGGEYETNAGTASR